MNRGNKAKLVSSGVKYKYIAQPVKGSTTILRTRTQNEKKFGSWDELPDGRRRYRLDVPGRSGWLARYLKDVGADDATLRFWQEIYDDQGRLVEIHEKYPLDEGHRKV